MQNRKAKNYLARIKSVIEGDRKNVSCGVEKMLKYDLMCVLRGYFENATAPEVEIYTDRGKVRVRVTLSAKSVKSAGVKINRSDSLR